MIKKKFSFIFTALSWISIIWLGMAAGSEGYEFFDTWKLRYVTNVLGRVKAGHSQRPRKMLLSEIVEIY